MNVFLHINGVQHVTIEQQIQLQSSVQIMPNVFGVIAVKKKVSKYLHWRCHTSHILDFVVFFMKRIVPQNNGNNISMTLDILQKYVPLSASFFILCASYCAGFEC